MKQEVELKVLKKLSSELHCSKYFGRNEELPQKEGNVTFLDK